MLDHVYLKNNLLLF